MDASSTPPPAAPPPGAGLVGAAVIGTGAGASAAAGSEVAVRVVPVVPGQSLQATVVALQDGLAWLGYRGSLFAARVDAPLQAGSSYDFTVVRTSPVVELALRTAAAAPLPEALPGPSTDRLRSLLQAVANGPRERAADGASAAPAFAVALRELARGAMSGPLLRDLVRGLGHDLEARVLRRLGSSAPSAEAAAAELRTTQKAMALGALADAATERVAGPEHALVAYLGAVERDNATRAELGLPTWMPLPNCPAVGLDDARWFLVQDEGGADGGAEADEPSWTIVLLLEFSRLGAVRVDVSLRETEVDVVVTAAEASTAHRLLDTVESLRADLTQGGLGTRSIRVQRSPAKRLPQSDLVVPPVDGTAMVDCRA